MCIHGILLSIISDRGAPFTSIFWRSFQKGLGTKVKLSTTFQLQTDGQAERAVQTLEDILMSCIIDFKWNWGKRFPFVEFSYNKSYHSSISIDHFKALYGIRCAFHVQTDGLVWFTIQTLEDILRAFIIDLKWNWDKHLHFVEFSYNNSYHSSISMAFFEA